MGVTSLEPFLSAIHEMAEDRREAVITVVSSITKSIGCLGRMEDRLEGRGHGEIVKTQVRIRAIPA